MLASGIEGDEDALPIRTQARVLGATVKAGETIEYRLGAERYGYLVSANGQVEVNGITLQARDGAAIHGEDIICVTASEDAELVLVDTGFVA